MIEQLYSILNEFKNPEYLIEKKVYRKICDFNNQKFKETKLPINSKFSYEQLAFTFMEGRNPPLEWGNTFYTPLFIDQWSASYPDIKDITPKIINYWEKRSSKVNNPILQCRYAGLVWDFSQKIRNLPPDRLVAYRFIDSVINMANLGGNPFLKYKLERGLKLAISINDQQKIIYVRDAIIKYEETHFEEDKPGTWGYSYDLLIGDKNLYRKIKLEKKQEEQIIKELERKLKNFSDKNSKAFNAHHVEYIITKLAPYYKGKNDIGSMKRVLLIYRDSFLYGIKNNHVMVGSHWLAKIRKILFQYGLTEEAKKLETNIRSLQKEDLNYLQKFETTIKIPKTAIDNYISELDRKNLSEALNCIALSFIPDKEEAKNIVLKIAKEHPLQTRMSQSIMDHTGRKVATIDPIENDLEGHIVRQMSESTKINLSFIALGLKHLKENKSLDANTLSEHLFKSFVFPAVNHQIIREGLSAYFNKNYIASCSILISQIESAIRELISVAGGTIYKPSNDSKKIGFELRPLGALLRDEIFTKVFEKLNSNIPDFFKILLIDKRSLNIRNSIYHGHSPASFFNEVVTIHIIHILLILSFLRKNKKPSRK